MELSNKKIGYTLATIAIVLMIATFMIKTELDDQTAYMCTVIEQTPDITMEDCPAHNDTYSWLLMLSFGIAIAILITGIYLLLPRQEEKKKHTEVAGLPKDERRVYELVKEAGSCFQSDLVRETENSKVKVTRLLDKLEQKGLVERKRRGMTNIIFLK